MSQINMDKVLLDKKKTKQLAQSNAPNKTNEDLYHNDRLAVPGDINRTSP